MRPHRHVRKALKEASLTALEKAARAEVIVPNLGKTSADLVGDRLDGLGIIGTKQNGFRRIQADETNHLMGNTLAAGIRVGSSLPACEKPYSPPAKHRPKSPSKALIVNK